MDLFDDIPDPVGSDNNSEILNKTLKSKVQLGKQNKTLTKASQGFTSKGLDLFSDLPSPSDIISNILISNGVTEKSSGSNLKRKATEETTSETVKRIHTIMYELQGFVAERKGEREEMQDAHTLLNDFHKHLHASLHPSVLRLAVYAVYDGHGGSRASRYMAARFPATLAAKFPKGGDLTVVERDIKKYFLEGFKRVDEDFLREAARHKPSWKDGTTAIVVLALNDILYIANLGDSKAVLCRYCPETQKYNAMMLSRDHSPTDYNERMRIQKSGGFIKDGRVLGILEVSRSIGDGQFKRCGVTCVPDVRRCQITEHDKFLLLACDGLWKVFTSDEVIQIINRCLQDESLEATEDKTAEEIRCESACTRLTNEAVRKLSGDNVTVLLVKVKPQGKRI